MKKLFNKLKEKALAAKTSVDNFVQDVKGDLATNTIVAVVIIGILVLAVNTFFPSFFTDMFSAMKDKLNANW